MAERLENGQFAPKHCGDPNCSGTIVRDSKWNPWGHTPILRCDGLTFTDHNGPLVACAIEFPAWRGKRT